LEKIKINSMMIIRFINKTLVELLVLIISIYQKTLSLDYGWFRSRFPGGYCRFRPTCSEYSKAALKKYGLIKGGILAAGRVLRCHPWSRGGWDPLL
jgi:hypothetical protein